MVYKPTYILGAPSCKIPHVQKFWGLTLAASAKPGGPQTKTMAWEPGKKKWEIGAGNKPKIMRYHGIISNVMKYVLDCFSMF